MENQNTVIIDLKSPVMNIEEEPMKNPDKVKEKMKINAQGQRIPKSQEEIRDEAPDLLKGELMAFVIMSFAKAKTKEQAATIKRLCAKIINVTRKKNGKWEVTEKDLKELEELVEIIPMEIPDANNSVGEIQIIIENAKEELFLKHRKNTD